MPLPRYGKWIRIADSSSSQVLQIMRSVFVHDERDHGGGNDAHDIRFESLIKAPPAFKPAKVIKESVRSELGFFVSKISSSSATNYKAFIIQKRIYFWIITKQNYSSSSGFTKLAKQMMIKYVQKPFFKQWLHNKYWTTTTVLETTFYFFSFSFSSFWPLSKYHKTRSFLSLNSVFSSFVIVYFISIWCVDVIVSGSCWRSTNL